MFLWGLINLLAFIIIFIIGLCVGWHLKTKSETFFNDIGE